MSGVEPDSLQWKNPYYKAVAERPPRELFRQTLRHFSEPIEAPVAVDLGCGAGIEALELLGRGWRLFAFDRESEAIEQLVARVSPELRARLRGTVCTFEQAELPDADFIWAGLSLPFCAPEHFPQVWTAIVESLRPGGRFAGDFFGTRHGWATREWMNFHSEEQVRQFLGPLHIEHFISEEGVKPTAVKNLLVPWHSYSVIARKP